MPATNETRKVEKGCKYRAQTTIILIDNIDCMIRNNMCGTVKQQFFIWKYYSLTQIRAISHF